MRTQILSMGMVSVFALAAPAFGAAPVVAPFTLNAENFVASTTDTVQVWLGTGGNPDGFVQIRKVTSVDAFPLGTRTSVTPEFLGNYAAAGINRAGFDLVTFNTVLDGSQIRFRPDVGTNGWHYNFGAMPASNSWVSLLTPVFDPTWSDVMATANGWTQEPGAPSFATLFSSVGWIEARFDNPGPTSALIGVDNVRLVPAPSAAAAGLLGLALVSRRRRR
ncbi:MAG TPA: hypothetical protein PKE29_04340 [Phycisphaerales bacterium]|nr:hypothetical protein [Phycisphaerales bacterium]